MKKTLNKFLIESYKFQLRFLPIPPKDRLKLEKDADNLLTQENNQKKEGAYAVKEKNNWGIQ